MTDVPAGEGVAFSGSLAGQRDGRLTPLGSAILDIIRFGAACVVCYGHFSMPLFSEGWKPRINLAGYAVAIFFVLSGFMMRLITTTRTMSPREYWVDRASRMYSVVLPALLLTVVICVIGLLYPSGHLPREIFAKPSALFRSTIADTTFTSQWLGRDINNPANPVFWSLSYECSYYLLFGLIVFGRSRKIWFGIGALCILLGLPILLLFPVWLSGCAAHDVYQWLRTRKRAWLKLTAVLCVLTLVCIVLRGAIGSASVRLRQTNAASWLLSEQHDLHRRNIHIFQRASVDFYVVGIPTAILMVWLLIGADRIQARVPIRATRWIRVVAEGTFALYLMHHALFVLFADLVPYPRGNLFIKCSILILTVCFCIAVSAPMDGLKRWLRLRMRGRPHGLLAEIDAG